MPVEALPTSDALADWRNSWSRTSELPTDPTVSTTPGDDRGKTRYSGLLAE
jgi:hypothetical protein